MVPFMELMEYADWQNYRMLGEGRLEAEGSWVSELISKELKLAVIERIYAAAAKHLGWAPRSRLVDSIAAAEPFLREDLYGEAVVTVGGVIHEFHAGEISGAINVGPFECMPTKVAEAQFFHVAEKLGLTTLTVLLNGDPLSSDVLDGFAHEVHAAHQQRKASTTREKKPGSRQDHGRAASSSSQTN